MRHQLSDDKKYTLYLWHVCEQFTGWTGFSVVPQSCQQRLASLFLVEETNSEALSQTQVGAPLATPWMTFSRFLDLSQDQFTAATRGVIPPPSQHRSGNYTRQCMDVPSTCPASWVGARLAKTDLLPHTCRETLTFNLVLRQNYKGCHIMELLNSSNRGKTTNIKTETAVALVCSYKYGAE